MDWESPFDPFVNYQWLHQFFYFTIKFILFTDRVACCLLGFQLVWTLPNLRIIFLHLIRFIIVITTVIIIITIEIYHTNDSGKGGDTLPYQKYGNHNHECFIFIFYSCWHFVIVWKHLLESKAAISSYLFTLRLSFCAILITVQLLHSQVYECSFLILHSMAFDFHASVPQRHLRYTHTYGAALVCSREISAFL